MIPVRLLVALVAAIGLVAGAAPAGAGPRQLSAAAIPGAGIGASGGIKLAGGIRLTGMESITDMSADGRLMLGRMDDTGPMVVRDIVAGRTLATLPTSSARHYQSMSADGRRISYSRVLRRGGCAYMRPWVLDRRTGKSKLAAADSRGRAVLPTWKQATGCASYSLTEAAFGMDLVGGPGQMSPDGRYVAFCANLKVRARMDLYVKDLRTGKLSRRNGLCARDSGDGGDAPGILPAYSAEGARAVMVPQGMAQNNSGQWANLLTSRSARPIVVPPGSAGAHMMWLTDDGSALYVVTDGGTRAGRYDTRTATLSSVAPTDPLSPGALQPADEYREMVSMSRRGRYVAYNGSRIDPAQGRVGLMGVYDRRTGTAVDLSAALVAAGVELQVGDPPTAPNSQVNAQLSSDGKVLLFPSPSGWVALTWRP